MRTPKAVACINTSCCLANSGMGSVISEFLWSLNFFCIDRLHFFFLKNRKSICESLFWGGNLISSASTLAASLVVIKDVSLLTKVCFLVNTHCLFCFSSTSNISFSIEISSDKAFLSLLNVACCCPHFRRPMQIISSSFVSTLRIPWFANTALRYQTGRLFNWLTDDRTLLKIPSYMQTSRSTFFPSASLATNSCFFPREFIPFATHIASSSCLVLEVNNFKISVHSLSDSCWGFLIINVEFEQSAIFWRCRRFNVAGAP